jgi:outer membrane protein OmpA-like peptidoglycan-associated protein
LAELSSSELSRNPNFLYSLGSLAGALSEHVSDSAENPESCMVDQTNVQADIPFVRWRPNDIVVEDKPPSAVKQSTAPAQAVIEREPENVQLKSPTSAPSQNSGAVFRSVTAGGIAATQAARPLNSVLVAPAGSVKEFNTIRSSIVPLACWRAQDMRFEFESSFVKPEISSEIAALKELIDRHTLTDESGKPVARPPLTVFGHADPSGNDDFNKALSGRRAIAMFALVTRKVELWERLHSHPLGNDNWDPRAVETMQITLGLEIGPKPSAAARAALFKAYMDHVCTARDANGVVLFDDAGSPIQLELKPTDFLAAGKDPEGKGDFQGCGEFNPILMFSAAENQRFADSQRKSDRDAENAPNRRVLIFLFRPGVRIIPNLWPCPRATEGVTDCKRRFFSDAATRRTFQEKRREFEDDRDTFACRFYDRLSDKSPCERGLTTMRIRLYDPAGNAIPRAPFDVVIGLRKPTPIATADNTGIIVVQDIEVPNRCVVRWGFPPSKVGEKPELIFTLDMFLSHDNLSNAEEAKQKLHNLGYVKENRADENISAFQRDYGHLATPPLEVDGKLGANTIKLLRDVYDQCAQDLRNTPPAS